MPAEPRSLEEYASAAEDILSKSRKKDVLRWINLGSETQSTIRNNIESIAKIKIFQRVLTGISKAELNSVLLGKKVAAPIIAAPISGLERIYPGAQADVVQACSELGLPCFVGHFNEFTPEELAKRAKAPLIWMSYITQGKEEEVHRLAEKAERLGYAAFGITVDAPTYVKLGDEIQEFYKRHTEQVSVTFDQVSRLRKKTSLPFIVKGILHPDDAKLAVEAGANAVVVSNHGGRILDHCAGTIEALPKVVEAVSHIAEVYIDGGFRRGTDILKALALGADAVLVGRPVAWGLVVKKKEGVKHVLSILENGLEHTCFLAGFSSVREVNKSAIFQ